MGDVWTKTNCQPCLWGGCCRTLRLTQREISLTLCAISACWGQAEDEVNHMARSTLHAVYCCMTKPVCGHEASTWQQKYTSLLGDPVRRSWWTSQMVAMHAIVEWLARAVNNGWSWCQTSGQPSCYCMSCRSTAAKKRHKGEQSIFCSINWIRLRNTATCQQTLPTAAPD
jgi:hypothetical protein